MSTRRGKTKLFGFFYQRLLFLFLIPALIMVVAIKTMPGGGAPSSNTSGDPQLIAQLTPLLSGARDRVSVALIDPQGVRYAFWGANPDTQYEIGSITKTFTAALLADAVERREVTLDTPLGDILELGDSTIGQATLRELATHHAGLSSISSRWFDQIKILLAVVGHRDPYPVDRLTLLEQAKADPLSSRGRFSYSNMGFALLGDALAERTQHGYASLVTERLLRPMGLTQTSIPEKATNLPRSPTTGYSIGGFRERPWTMMAYAPAGGMRSTITDMARYAQRLLEGTFPGQAALIPREQTDEQARIGMAWFISTFKGRVITWHNGSTGGFSSMIVLDRQAGEAVVMLSNTASPLESTALSLLLSHDTKRTQ